MKKFRICFLICYILMFLLMGYVINQDLSNYDFHINYGIMIFEGLIIILSIISLIVIFKNKKVKLEKIDFIPIIIMVIMIMLAIIFALTYINLIDPFISRNLLFIPWLLNIIYYLIVFKKGRK